jgi:hypothetical protein
MAKLSCYAHRLYSGEGKPDLTCKICCKLFVESLKEKLNSILVRGGDKKA